MGSKHRHLRFLADEERIVLELALSMSHPRARPISLKNAFIASYCPRGAAIEYVPSQYLCEIIEKAGWGGVVFRSSVSDGINLALFAPANAVPEAVDQWRVTKVMVDIDRH